MFSLALYDVKKNATLVPIRSISVWVEVFCLPPNLMTKEALCMVGATLGWIINHDNPNLLSGARARVRMEHSLDSPVKQAYPQMRFDFKEGMNLTFVMLTFKYERVCGLCRGCGMWVVGTQG